MIVVADSGPIIHLSMVRQLELLPRFYGEICIPRIVYREVVEDGAGLPGSAELQHIGTLGILLAARKRGLVGALRPLLQALRAQGFWMSESVEEAVLKQAGEAE